MWRHKFGEVRLLHGGKMESPSSPSSTSSRHSPPLQGHAMVPMVEIEAPYENDVLSGRGVTTNRHPGNINFRQLVSLNKELYVTSTKRQKMSISKSIVEAVRSMDPPGRFLEKNAETGMWSDIGDKKAIEKTSQALRDGAASLRKQLSEDLGDPDFLSAVFDMDVSETKSSGDDNKEPVKPKEKDEKAAKVKPTVTKSHRRTKSNPTIGVASRAKSMAALRKAKPSEIPLSPPSRRPSARLPTSPSGSLPLSPEREESREPFQNPTSPRSQPSSPQSGWANRANWRKHNDHQRVPSESHEERMPDRCHSRSPFHRVEPSSHHRGLYERSYSFDQPPYRSDSSDYSRHHPPPPPRSYNAPGYPPAHYRPGPPPMSQHPTSPLPPGSHHFSPHGYQSKPPLSPPSVPWSPRVYSGHSPHHSVHPHDYRRQGSPKYRFSPGGGYQVHHPGPYASPHHQSLHVPVLGGERHDGRRSLPARMHPGPSFMHPPPPPHHHEHSPRGYPPTSVPSEFAPPPSRIYDNHPDSDYPGPHYHHHDYPHPEPPQSCDMDAQVYVEELPGSNTKLEIREDSIEATPSRFHRDSSPSAVADVAPSAVIKKEEDFPDVIDPSSVTKSGDDDDVSINTDVSRLQDRDDDNDPAYDDASISPLPFDYEGLDEDPESLMDIPDNIMSLPIAPFEPLEPGAA